MIISNISPCIKCGNKKFAAVVVQDPKATELAIRQKCLSCGSVKSESSEVSNDTL